MASLRVISGTARGRRLKSVPGDTTRPITDRVKEALFNILGADIHDAILLDLFAGTGAVGIEALSRGASHVVFNDRHRLAIKTIRENLALTRLEAGARVLQSDAFALLAAPPDQPFDYIYIAPPQYSELWSRALQSLDANLGWLAPDGWAIVQIDPLEYAPPALSTLEEIDQRRYGSTLLVFYARPEPEDG